MPHITYLYKHILHYTTTLYINNIIVYHLRELKTNSYQHSPVRGHEKRKHKKPRKKKLKL